MLFFSREDCINDKIKKTYQQAVIIHSALTIYIVANDNTHMGIPAETAGNGKDNVLKKVFQMCNKCCQGCSGEH